MDKNLINLFRALHESLVLIYKSDNKIETQQVFAVTEFNWDSPSSPIGYTEIRGKDVTEYFNMRENIIHNIGDENVLITKLSKLPIERVKFSTDYTWEWYS
jgi:hypothetical protein